MQERLRRDGSKTHKERVEELNKYLSGLTEHHDMYVLGCLTRIYGLVADDFLGRKLVPVEIDVFVLRNFVGRFCLLRSFFGLVLSIANESFKLQTTISRELKYVPETSQQADKGYVSSRSSGFPEWTVTRS